MQLTGILSTCKVLSTVTAFLTIKIGYHVEEWQNGQVCEGVSNVQLTGWELSTV